MKKIVKAALAAVMALGMAACGSSSGEKSSYSAKLHFAGITAKDAGDTVLELTDNTGFTRMDLTGYRLVEGEWTVTDTMNDIIASPGQTEKLDINLSGDKLHITFEGSDIKAENDVGFENSMESDEGVYVNADQVTLKANEEYAVYGFVIKAEGYEGGFSLGNFKDCTKNVSAGFVLTVKLH